MYTMLATQDQLSAPLTHTRPRAARRRAERNSPEALRLSLVMIEEELMNIQGDVRDLLRIERMDGKDCALPLARLTQLLGQMEISAIRTQYELEMAEEG